MKKVRIIMVTLLIVAFCFSATSCGEEKYEAYTFKDISFSLPETFLEDDEDVKNTIGYGTSDKTELFEISAIDYDKTKYLKASKQIKYIINGMEKSGTISGLKTSKTKIGDKEYKTISGTIDNTKSDDYDKDVTIKNQQATIIFIARGYRLYMLSYETTKDCDTETAKEHKSKIFSKITLDWQEAKK